MNEIIYTKSYKDYKEELDTTLKQTAEGFVKIGYLLKVARDTNILMESGYKTVAEFAKAEYNLDKTQVSRFIAINDKFAEGGYSDKLGERYSGFGYAKLTLMLQLPDSINEELTPNYTKSEIQSIKDEITEENKTTEIELYLERQKEYKDINSLINTSESNLYKALYQLGQDEPKLFKEIYDIKNDVSIASIKEIMTPSAEKTYSIRIKGVGRILLMLKDYEDTVAIIDSRSGNKEKYTWLDIVDVWKNILSINSNADIFKAYKDIYNIEFPNTEFAPVQQKESKVNKANIDIKKAAVINVEKEIEKNNSSIENKTEDITESFNSDKTGDVEDIENNSIEQNIEEDIDSKQETEVIDSNEDEDKDTDKNKTSRCDYDYEEKKLLLEIRDYTSNVLSITDNFKSKKVSDYRHKLDEMLMIAKKVVMKIEELQEIEYSEQ
jgi:hypothetical protein